jgi:hypothetical protein
MRSHRVNAAVNSVRNDTPEAAAPANTDDPLAAPSNKQAAERTVSLTRLETSSDGFISSDHPDNYVGAPLCIDSRNGGLIGSIHDRQDRVDSSSKETPET